MQNEIVKVFGDKLAIVELGRTIEGEIIIPEAVQKSGNFRIGRVIAEGDGTGIERVGRHTLPYPGEMFVHVDDAILFQMPRSALVTSAYQIRGMGEVSIVVQGDCLARIKPTKTDIVGEVNYILSPDTLEALGDWVLLSAQQIDIDEDAIIKRPDNALDITLFRFTVLQLGTGGDYTGCGYTVGDSVIIERMRVIPFTISTIGDTGIARMTELYFLPKDYVLGIVQPKD